ncbi:MAG: CysB family HTH-type transcriptional regulator [Methylophilaceae bacterium]|nr:CysB family HTH-type transcriptional regulator [Methylophilaceae bacterium]
MKIHQLRYVREVAKRGLNISLAAEALHTSQPGISKQIQLLEEELHLQIFQRNGKRLIGLTEPGRSILELAERVIRDMENIKRVGEEFCQEEVGTLTIAATHTQARYCLPAAVKSFIEQFPDVKLTIHQGSPIQVAEQVASGEADLGLATEAIGHHEKLLCLPCYQWNRSVVVPLGHPLLDDLPLTLRKIADYPLITYDSGVTGGSQIPAVFEAGHILPNIVLTAIDADVIKTYVGLGLGIGLLASMAYDKERDANLAEIDASHLFPVNTTYLGIRRDAYLRGYAYHMIQLLAPNYDKSAVNTALKI